MERLYQSLRVTLIALLAFGLSFVPEHESHPANSMSMRHRCVISLILFASLTSCQRVDNPPTGWIDEPRLLNGESEPGNWLSLGGNFKQQHYSPLTAINERNAT